MYIMVKNYYIYLYEKNVVYDVKKLCPNNIIRSLSAISPFHWIGILILEIAPVILNKLFVEIHGSREKKENRRKLK